MARQIEMGVLETRCQQRADLEHDDHIEHPERLSLISEVYGELFEIVADAGGRYFETRETLVTDGTNVLAEPYDVLSVMGLWQVEASGKRHIVKPMQPHEVTKWGGQRGQRAVCYEHVDAEILLYAQPPAGQNYELRFIPQAPDLSTFASNQCVDLVCAAGEAFMKWGYALVALAKSESDVRLAMTQKEHFAKKLKEWAVNRALVDPKPRYVADDNAFVSDASWRNR